MEYRLPSADEMDVLFMSTREQVVVEVKSKISNSVDLERGVFQCVKYRAVLQAQSDVSNPGSQTTVRALLVSEQPLGSRLAEWAGKLDVKVRVIRPLRPKTGKCCGRPCRLFADRAPRRRQADGSGPTWVMSGVANSGQEMG